MPRVARAIFDLIAARWSIGVERAIQARGGTRRARCRGIFSANAEGARYGASDDLVLAPSTCDARATVGARVAWVAYTRSLHATHSDGTRMRRALLTLTAVHRRIRVYIACQTIVD